jgi:hypothetical protein
VKKYTGANDYETNVFFFGSVNAMMEARKEKKEKIKHAVTLSCKFLYWLEDKLAPRCALEAARRATFSSPCRARESKH